jgi:hypothetical protein
MYYFPGIDPTTLGPMSRRINLLAYGGHVEVYGWNGWFR